MQASRARPPTGIGAEGAISAADSEPRVGAANRVPRPAQAEVAMGVETRRLLGAPKRVTSETPADMEPTGQEGGCAAALGDAAIVVALPAREFPTRSPSREGI
jgi:hypothetical protein